ncbi:MAG: hypothetical protein JXB85_18285 [Anaerolineales bacterium]|nr:hypothetical protein [Anaerolineales bacterium]
MNKIAFRNIFLIWLAWVFIMVGFQAWATTRFAIVYPDRSQPWTETYTGEGYQVDRPFLLDPFLNDQVSWDSEYYIGVAVGGYDDPRIPHLTEIGSTTYRDGQMMVGSRVITDEYQSISLAYAFFPFYPWMMWLVSWPLKVFGLNPTATATLAGVVVSALGTLGGMLALYDLTREHLDHEGGMRAVFYLLIFPTGFFLVQVYTEGLFVGLAFGCLAMLRRGGWYWFPAALLGAAATLTRAVGVALIIPMALTWFHTGDWMDIDLEWRQVYYWLNESRRAMFLAVRKAVRSLVGGVVRPIQKSARPKDARPNFLRRWGLDSAADPTWDWLGRELVVAVSFTKMLLAFAPLIAYLVWNFSRLGNNFDFIEAVYFGRGVMDLGGAFYNWSTAFRDLSIGIPARTAYYLTEFLGLIIGLATCVACLKRYPEIGWFSLAVFAISWGSGPVQGIHRYILGAPAVFYMLAVWGRNRAFDRAWTLASTLLMGTLAVLYAFDFWVA